jgi:hypothetical protein
MCTITALSSANASCSIQPGIQKAYFFDTADVSAITFDASTREVSAITLAASTYVRAINFDSDEAIVNVEGTSSYSKNFNQSILFNVNGRTAAIREVIQSWDACSCLGVIAILENGQRLWLGLEFDSTDASDVYSFKPKKNEAYTYASGTRLDGDKTNRFSRTYMFENLRNDAVQVASSVDLAALEE